jgi:hypothetical protein
LSANAAVIPEFFVFGAFGSAEPFRSDYSNFGERKEGVFADE